MSFDGSYVTEGRDFESVQAAWNRSEDMGSRWYFYPFHFVTTESGKTIVSAPEPMSHLTRCRVKLVSEHFSEVSKLPEMQNANIDAFALSV